MIRGANKWLWPVIQHQRRLATCRVRHVFLAICDHFEPMHHTDHDGATQRLLRWRDDYIVMAADYRDSSGRGPRHSFFYPIEQYDAGHLDLVMQICRATGSEIEVQLHHDNDTEETLTAKLQQGIADFTSHGALSVDAQGRTRFGFVHGNWALCNSRPDGRWCGVPTEIRLLRELGCYADFTFPSAPSPTQPRSVNCIGYATECGSAVALDRLEAASVSATTDLRHHHDKLLLVQGPLALNWARRKWGVLPRLENADLTKANPPTPQRLALWLQQQIQVSGREDWLFIKLHSHGATPANSQMLLGDAMRAFHQHFTQVLPETHGVQVNYVTAREMVNLIHAAEDGCTEPSPACLNHHLRMRES